MSLERFGTYEDAPYAARHLHMKDLTTVAVAVRKLQLFPDRSFHGGTDVDAPLALSLERLGKQEWSQVRSEWPRAEHAAAPAEAR